MLGYRHFDTWQFSGSQTSQYKQIGNAVPVNLGHAIGLSLVKLLNEIEKSDLKIKLPILLMVKCDFESD